MPEHPSRYISTFANRYGEEWIFEYDHQTERAIVKGSDVDWQEYVVTNGLAVGLIMDEEELLWLRSAWAAKAPLVAPNAFALSLLNGRNIATLATQRIDGSIHLTAIWYLYQDGYLYFPTSSTSQKVRNVEASPSASAMIDTRTPGQEQGLSVSGSATIIRGTKGRELVAQAQQRYLTAKALSDPQIGPAYAKFDDVVIALTPQRWATWNIAQMNEENFDGRLGVESGYLYPLG